MKSLNTVMAVALFASLAGVSASAFADGEGPYYYLRCNTTGWGLGEVNELKPVDFIGHGNAGAYRKLDVCIKSDGVVHGWDDCVLTVAEKAGVWNGTHQLGTGSQDLVVTDNGGSVLQFVADDWDKNFRIKYPHKGAFSIVLNTAGDGQLWIAPRLTGWPSDPAFACDAP